MNDFFLMMISVQIGPLRSMSIVLDDDNLLHVRVTHGLSVSGAKALHRMLGVLIEQQENGEIGR